ncbi:MAG: phosphatase PAP2 family protein [Halopseudomonas sp.]|uniref:phosphatase PAP2 family protein n=1 Tax=Halopseudomonas sp. TaxID=2901191 RepID=UPI00300393A7
MHSYQQAAALPMRLALAAAIALALAGCNDSSSDKDDSAGNPVIEKPAKPAGLGSEQTVAVPEAAYPAPVIVNAENNADGTLRWVLDDNPVAYLLRDINQIWKGTADSYQQGASGDGPADYLDDPIVDAAAWKSNIGYVIDVTKERTDDKAILAFLDDVRSKNYSVIDGYGPLSEAYVASSGAYVDVPVPTVNQVLQDVNFKAGNNDGIAWAGSKTSELGAVVTLVDAFRQRAPASTNAAKYIFSTPRPWRMDDNGAIDFLGTANHNCYDVNGNLTVQLTDQYTTSVSLVPGLTCAQRPHSNGDHDKGLYTENGENRRKDGGYPSGHTNAGYLAAMAYAYALPQRYAEMLTRGSQLGENRIVAGMHSPVDVIGGRIHSMMVASAALARPEILDEATAAYNQAQDFFGRLAEQQGTDLYSFAHEPVASEKGLIDGSMINTQVYNTSQYDDHALNKEQFASA